MNQRALIWLGVAGIGVVIVLSAMALAVSIRTARTTHQRDVVICKAVRRVTSQSNSANGSLSSVLNQSLANIQARANTAKELPTDKQSARVFIKLIAALRTSRLMDC